MSGYCDISLGPRHFSAVRRAWRTFHLFCGIVFRETEGDYRMMPPLAWEIARGIWRNCECYDCNPGRRKQWTGVSDEEARRIVLGVSR